MTEKWPWQLNLGDDDHDRYCLKVIITGKLFENNLTKSLNKKVRKKLRSKCHLYIYIYKKTLPIEHAIPYLVFLHPFSSMSFKTVWTKSVGSLESGRFVLMKITFTAPVKTAWNLFSVLVSWSCLTSLARASSMSSESLSLTESSSCKLCSGPKSLSAY